MTDQINHFSENAEDVPPFNKQQAKEQLAYAYRNQVARVSFSVRFHDDDHRYDGCVSVDIGDRENVDGFHFIGQGDDDE